MWAPEQEPGSERRGPRIFKSSSRCSARPLAVLEQQSPSPISQSVTGSLNCLRGTVRCTRFPSPSRCNYGRDGMAGLRVEKDLLCRRLLGNRQGSYPLRWIPMVPNLSHGVWSPHCWQINLSKLLFPSHLPLLQSLRVLGLCPAELHKLFRSIFGRLVRTLAFEMLPSSVGTGRFPHSDPRPSASVRCFLTTQTHNSVCPTILSPPPPNPKKVHSHVYSILQPLKLADSRAQSRLQIYLV